MIIGQGATANHFIQKLELSNMKCGVISIKHGISGKKAQKKGKEVLRFGKLIQVKTFNGEQLAIFNLTYSDLKRIFQGQNLALLLLKKYENIKFA